MHTSGSFVLLPGTVGRGAQCSAYAAPCFAGLKSPSGPEGKAARHLTSSDGDEAHKQASRAEASTPASADAPKPMGESPAGAAVQDALQSSEAGSTHGAQSAALILQALQSLSAPPDAASASKALPQGESRNSSAESGVATAVVQRKVILHRYASAGEQAASALSASRTQSGETMSPQPSAEHGHSPEQEQCIQQLRDRVSHYCPSSL